MRSLSGFALSSQQIKDTVNHLSGRSIIAPRFQLLDRTLSPIAVPGTDSATDPSDFTNWVQSARIDNDCSLDAQMAPTKPVHRSLSITFKEVAGLSLNTLSTQIRVWQDWKDGSGNTLFSVPRGIFSMIVPDRDLAKSGNLWTINCGDTTTWLNTISIPNTYTVAAGTNYVTAIQRILQLDPQTGTTPAGAPCYGPGIPSSRINITSTTSTTPASITFAVGTTLLAAINQLLSAITYWPLWVDEDGIFQSSPMPYYTNNMPTAGWTYTTDSTSVIQGPVQQRWPNQADLGNVAKVYSENNGTTTFSSLKTNTNPASAVSIPNVGRAICPASGIVQDDLLPDQATCDQKCALVLQRMSQLTEQVSFVTTLNPFLQSHDYILVNVTDKQGNPEISSPASAPFHVDTWSEDLGTRLTTWSLSRAVQV